MTDEQWHEELIRQYPKVKSHILKTYRQPEKFIVINADDPDLQPFKINMPECPPLHTIEGFGLSALEQKFQYDPIPRSLIQLEKQIADATTKEDKDIPIIDRIWSVLEQQQEDYQDEIKYIKRQIYRRFNGYWCFIKGQPTFLDGWHYTYLNFWRFKTRRRPDYRDVHRRRFHAVRYAYTCTSIPMRDDKGVYLFDEDGFIREKDIGERTLFGITNPKNRRFGATNMDLCVSYLETITKFGVVSGILSITGPKAYEHYMQILVPGWKYMPFFFKPITAGNNNPETGLKMYYPPRKNSYIDPDSELNSIMNYADTAQASFYDGDKLFIILVDEQGKATLVNVSRNWEILRNCLAQGNGAVIEGFALFPSTVGEMEGGGGKQFMELCMASHWQERNANGRTQSGLINIFFKAEDGLEGFVDEYGQSLIEDPAYPVACIGENGRKIIQTKGARTYLKNERQAKLDAGDIGGYLHLCRLFPQLFREAFSESADDAGMNMVILEERYQELSINPPKTLRVGNFEWKDGIIDGQVVWKDDPMGKFRLTFMPHPNDQSRKIKRDGVFYPADPDKFISSGDPYRFDKVKTKGRRVDGGGRSGGSKGGIAVFRNRDMQIDPDTKDRELWETHRFVCTYRHRPPTLKEYCEDVLMATVFFGAMQYPEHNVNAIGPHFIERGYMGYLLYDTDPETGEPVPNAGFNSMGKSKQPLWNANRDYIEEHGYREEHIDVIQDCKEIKGIDDMTTKDVFVAAGGCLLATKSRYPEYISGMVSDENSNKNFNELMEEYADGSWD